MGFWIFLEDVFATNVTKIFWIMKTTSASCRHIESLKKSVKLNFKKLLNEDKTLTKTTVVFDNSASNKPKIAQIQNERIY